MISRIIKAKADDTYLDLDYSDITKTESNNNYSFQVLYIVLKKIRVTQHYMKHCLTLLLEIVHCPATYRLVTSLLAEN